MTLAVPPGIRPARLDAYVALCLPQFSRSRLADMIEHGFVTVGGRTCVPSHRLRGGEAIVVTVPPAVEHVVGPVEMPLSILYEDEHMVVIDKPAGLVVHPGAGTIAPTLVHGMLHRFPDMRNLPGDPDRQGIVHRLDKDTSGCIIVARTEAMRLALIGEFSRRKVRKEYYALVAGVPEERFCIETEIGRSMRDRKKMSVRTAHGREAITHVSVQDTFGVVASGLAVRIITGRTHQIRVHLAYAGHPVLGDMVYGAAARGLSDRVGAARQMLHAHKLTVVHPITGKELTVTSPLPADMVEVIEALRTNGTKQ